MKTQEIYINMDDSGKLSPHEQVCVYGGLIFLSKKDKDKFITQYRSIIKSIRCKYCHKSECNHKCPEIKNTNILPADKRRLMNYIKKYWVIALVINNNIVYDHILESKGAKGRFIDYAIRRIIKESIKNLIKNNEVNAYRNTKLIINIDEQSTKNNGYYNLKDGLFEELKHGITNFNYGGIITPIIHGEFTLSLCYQNSANSYVVQAADLLAGTIRHKSLQALTNNDDAYTELSKFVDFKIILP